MFLRNGRFIVVLAHRKWTWDLHSNNREPFPWAKSISIHWTIGRVHIRSYPHGWNRWEISSVSWKFGISSALRRLVEGGTLVKSLIWNPLSYAVAWDPERTPGVTPGTDLGTVRVEWYDIIMCYMNDVRSSWFMMFMLCFNMPAFFDICFWVLGISQFWISLFKSLDKYKPIIITRMVDLQSLWSIVISP